MAKVYFYKDSTESTDSGKRVVQDVDGVENKLTISYTDGTDKELEITASGGSGEGTGTGIGISQVTKLDVTAPKDVAITVKPTSDFRTAPVEVLKVKEGADGQVRTMCEFNNDDASDFEENDFVIFDGTMKLRTERLLEELSREPMGDGFIATFLVDKSRLGTEIAFDVVV